MAEATTLVKYLAAHGGYSRRDVTELIKEGKVTVSGSLVKEPWQVIAAGDDIRLDSKKVMPGKKVYFLLNKPTGYITTMEDNLGREDVSLLMKGATKERIFPIGRLDRDTTGLLVFTNDGELAQQLSHPRFNMKKEYMVTLDKPVNPEHLKLMFKGLYLRDGKARADRAVLMPGKRKYMAIIEIHSGKKHIIRRMFEHFGYEVRELDRIDYAGLSKKGLALGKWRALTEEEITSLKSMAQDAAKKARKPKPRTGPKREFDDKQRKPSGRSFGAGLKKDSRFERTERPALRKRKELIVGTEEWFNQQDLPAERSQDERKESTYRAKPERGDIRTNFRRSDSNIRSDYTPKRTTKSHKDRDERASWKDNKESKSGIENWFNQSDDERPSRSRSRDGAPTRSYADRATGDERPQRRTNFREDSNRFGGRSQSRDDRSERPSWRDKRGSDVEGDERARRRFDFGEDSNHFGGRLQSRDDRNERFSSRNRRSDAEGDERPRRRTDFGEDSNHFGGRSQSRDDRNERFSSRNRRTDAEGDERPRRRTDFADDAKPKRAPYKPRTGGSKNMVSTKPAYKKRKPGGGKPTGRRSK